MKVPRCWAAWSTALAATLLLVAACGGGSPGAASAPPSPAAARAASASQLSGAQLKSALLPGSAFPAGYVIYPKNSYNSGSRVQNPVTRYDLATVSCGTFVIQLGTPGFGETAMATDEFLNRGQDRAYLQLIYQFPRPGTASAFFAGLRAATLRCRSFTATEYGSPTRFTQQVRAAAPVSGHQAMQINQASTSVGSSGTAPVDYLFVLDGADVYGTILAGFTAAGLPASPSAPAVIARLIARVSALH